MCSSASALPSKLPRALRWLVLLVFLSWASGCASLPANDGRTASTAFAQPQQTALGQLVDARRSEAGTRSDSGFFLLDSAESALTSRLALVDGAQRSLDLQYYAIHADASSEVILQRLRDAARRGVRVRILLDDFNSVGEDAQVLRLAFEPNVQVRLFNPLAGPRNNMLGRIVGSLGDVGSMQKRMHNKLFIADNAWGITGGRNLGDRYFGDGEKQNFIDLDVLAAGRIVRDMSASFDRFWNDPLAYPVQTLLDPEDLEAVRKPPASAAEAAKPVLPVTDSPTVLPSVTPTAAARAERPSMDLATVPLIWAPATLLVDQPGKIGPGEDEVDAGETVIDGLLQLMQQAQRDVLIISPYFVPGERMMDVYRQLRQRGVRIRVLTNSMASNDAPAAHAGYARYRDDLLAMGVELYEMRSDPETAAGLLGSGSSSRRHRGAFFGSGPGGSKGEFHKGRASLHSKAVIIDQRLAVIGSMNLDLRSQLKNSEVALVIRSAALSQVATRQIEEALATAAYHLQRRDGKLLWQAPPGVSFGDETHEPGASLKLRLLVRLLAPFAPDEML